MSFLEIQFPTNISFNSSGGAGFMTSVITTDAGIEERFSRWQNPRRRYNAGYGDRTLDDLFIIQNFFITTKGAANGFRFKDWQDFTTAANGQAAHDYDDVVIATGDDSETQFQLVKYYTVGSTTRTRSITKPVNGAVKVALNGVEQTSGWTVNTVTGIITFSTPPATGITITAGCEFDVPVRFGESVDRELSSAIETFGSGTISDIELVEIRDELGMSNEFFYGGGGDIEITANVSISVSSGRVLRYDTSTPNLKIFLPNPTSLPDGGPYFYLSAIGTEDILLRTHDDSDTVATLTAGGNTAVILLTTDTSLNKVWYTI